MQIEVWGTEGKKIDEIVLNFSIHSSKDYESMSDTIILSIIIW